MQIDRVFSLGAWCQTAHQIQRYFGQGWSSPFDWTVAPLHSIEAVLSDHGARLGQSFSAWDNGKDVLCNEYGLLYHHEFARNPDVTFRFDIASIEACRSKMLHKLGSMREAAGHGATLFVRFGGHADDPFAWPYRVDPRPLRVSELNRTLTALDAFTGDGEAFLAVSYHPEHTAIEADEEPRPGLLLYRFERVGLEELTEEGWRGFDGNWDAFFAYCGERLTLPTRATGAG